MYRKKTKKKVIGQIVALAISSLQLIPHVAQNHLAGEQGKQWDQTDKQRKLRLPLISPRLLSTPF